MLTQDEKRIITEQAMRVMKKVHATLMFRHPMWGSLASRLTLVANWNHPTFYTDMEVLGFNPGAVMTRSFDDLLYIAAHEVCHCALKHPVRRKGRDGKVWNTACDHAVNLTLNRDPEMKARQPADATIDEKFAGLSAERIFILLQGQQEPPEPEQGEQEPDATQARDEALGDGGAEQEEDDDQSDEQQEQGAEQDDGDEESDSEGAAEGDDSDDAGDGEGDEEGEGEDAESDEGDEEGEGDAAGEGDEGESGEPGSTKGSAASSDDLDQRGATGGFGDVIDAQEGGNALDDAQVEALEREWDNAVEAAALAAVAGSEARGAARAMQEQNSPRVSYEEVMQRFLVERSRNADTWSRLNERYRASGILLPGRGGYGAQTLFVAVDTSSSITRYMLGQFQSALQRACDQAQVEQVVIVYADQQVCAMEECEASQIEFTKTAGGGGTLFAPTFECFDELSAQGREFCGLLYLTDQDNYDPGRMPDFAHINTLWVNPGVVRDPPFGEACSMLDQ